MSAVMRRAASLIVGLAMTFTPGVVLACAALLCAPSGHHAAAAPDAPRAPQTAAGHEHHHQAAAEPVVSARGHARGGHATVSAADDTPVFLISTPRVESVSRDCCASSARWSEPAIVSQRIDILSHIDALVVLPARESERDVAVTASGPPPHRLPRYRSTSTRVLRI